MLGVSSSTFLNLFADGVETTATSAGDKFSSCTSVDSSGASDSTMSSCIFFRVGTRFLELLVAPDLVDEALLHTAD